jgi:hypothetical protein
MRRRKMREIPESKNRPSTVCSAEYAYKKAKAGVRLNKWEIEKISENAAVSYKYAIFLGKRFEQGEKSILGDPNISVQYASAVIGGRWETAEPVILMNPCASLSYAQSVIKGRWEACENFIIDDYHSSSNYLSQVVKGRWSQFEEKILNLVAGKNKKNLWKGYFWDDPKDIFKNYLKYIDGRWVELEEVLHEKNNVCAMYFYAIHLGSKLPGALHEKMVMNSFGSKSGWSKKYIKFLKRAEDKARNYFLSLDKEERDSFLTTLGA